jgi:DNA-binding beta-propeller fold protein YncE
MSARVALVVACLLSSAPLAHAGTLSFAGSFVPPAFAGDPNAGGQGIAFDPASGHLFLANEGGGGSTVLEMLVDGSLVNTIVIGAGQVAGIDVLPIGHLLAGDGGGTARGAFEYLQDGTQVPAPTGIELDLAPVTTDVKGIAFHPGRNTLFVADDDATSLREIALDGSLLGSIVTSSLDAAFLEPEGIAVNPATGRLLVVNDGGSERRLWDVDPAGTLVASYPLGGPSGYQDPNGAALDAEGVTIDPATGTLYVAFHANRAVGVYVLDSDGDGVPDGADNCALAANADQADTDADGTGDACDADFGVESDGDGVPDASDVCPFVPDPAQADTDGDGIGDPCDAEPLSDADADGVLDGFDACADSDLDATLRIGRCNTRVPNAVDAQGCSLRDRVELCAEGASSHKRFARCVTRLTHELKRDQLITHRQKARILVCTHFSTRSPFCGVRGHRD